MYFHQQLRTFDKLPIEKYEQKSDPDNLLYTRIITICTLHHSSLLFNKNTGNALFLRSLCD